MRVSPALWLPVLAACASSAGGRTALLRPDPVVLDRPSPDSFDVRFETTRGEFVIRARRDWSPLGVDRFHYLAKARFYDGARFFRVIAGFVAQFGLRGEPAVDSVWQDRGIADEPVQASNHRSTVAFARGGPNSRSAQLYVNLADNARLDTVSSFGFPPIGEVVLGMAVVDSLFAGYGGTRQRRLEGPSQDSIAALGNAYLTRSYPKLDAIRKARVVKEWQARRRD
jgi:peptidyl-prolyl cis-trans isomerase A (cyclophilin A)